MADEQRRGVDELRVDAPHRRRTELSVEDVDGTPSHATEPTEERQPREPSLNEMTREMDSSIAGPGVVATKSQTQGALIGTVVGTLLGALLGLLVAPLFGTTVAALAISVIAFAVAGATAGGVAGGFRFRRERQQAGDADL